MAASDAMPVPKKNVAYRHYFALRKADGTLATGWAGADSEVSKDGGTFTDCTNEATEIGSTGVGYIDLTSAEMNADCVILKSTFTTTDALPFVVALFPEEAGDIRTNTTQIEGSDPTDQINAACDAAFASFVGGAEWTTVADNVAAILVDTGTTGVVVANSSKSGYSLSSGGLAAVTAWSVNLTGNITGNLTGSVGSISGVTFPANFADLAITGMTGTINVGAIEGTSPDDYILAQVNAGLASYDGPTKAEMDAAFTEIKGATWASGTDTLEQIRNTIDGLNDLDAAGIRSAVGLASANLDTQLSTIDTVVDSILADTSTDGVVVAAASKTGYTLSASGLASVTAWTVNITGNLSGSVGSVTSEVTANVSKINTVTIIGNGSPGNLFRV